MALGLFFATATRRAITACDSAAGTGSTAALYGGSVTDSVPAPAVDPAAGAEPEIEVTVTGPVGHLRLNRPRRINALTQDMIVTVRQTLERWRDNETVQVVLIDGAGERGLCAGADIRELRSALLDAGSAGVEQGTTFFVQEYAMNAELAEYPKPIVALMDGIVLGGGMGISAHCRIRVATERSSLGMPETAIGLFPDVGILHLLARAPGEVGTHAALTGARFGAADAVAAGLVDHVIPSSALDDLRAALVAGRSPEDPQLWSELSAGLEAAPATLTGPDRAWIDAGYTGDEPGDVLAIVRRLQARDEPAAQAAADTLRTMSPTSLAVSLVAIRRAAGMTLRQVLEQDLTLATACLRHPDLSEGIRARLVDRDNDPHWTPALIEDLDPTAVHAYFD